MSKISTAFEGKKAFIAFITCGDPDLETTEKAVREMVKAGAGLIELGIPFSDPTAEGPVIQAANVRALSAGTKTEKIFEMVARLREDITTPMVFMTYANVVYSYGTERFIARAAQLGIDGLILPDVPFEEKDEFAPVCERYGLDWISFVAPTSEERISMIAREAKGFIYVISSLGVTGVRQSISTDLERLLAKIRAVTDTPCAVGFGIAEPQQAREVSRVADGVIVGSAIVKRVAQAGREAPALLGAYVKEMVEAMA